MKLLIVIAIIAAIATGVYFLFIKNSGPEAPGTGGETVNEVALELLAQGFTSPVAFVSAKDGTGRMFVADQIGVIKILNSQGQIQQADFLDLKSKMVSLNPNYDERGLLGLAFHPGFKNNGRFFVYYSAPLRGSGPAGWNHTSIISEFSVSVTNPDVANPNSEKIILQIDEPQSNHNGGHIAFGPDGNLYIPLGDGGQANDTGLGHNVAIGNGQDINALLGKVLRINIDQGNPYSIPPDNPFSGEDGRDEIYALGFRNPYHISFDMGGNNELFVADVGQNLWEEVNIVEKGNNYGWNIREGNHCFNPQSPSVSPEICPGTGADGETLISPIIEYKNANNGGIGVANVGGYVYRGNEIEGLKGNYIFADFSKGFTSGDGSVFAALEKDQTWSFRELKISNISGTRVGLFIKGVGQDENNELYLLATEKAGPSGNSGKIFKIVKSGSETQSNQPGQNETIEKRVSIKNFAFTPQILTISKGTEVTWKNEDSMPHTVTSQGNFDSGNMAQDAEYSLTFNEVGTFNYICTLHPYMTGRVIVE